MFGTCSTLVIDKKCISVNLKTWQASGRCEDNIKLYLSCLRMGCNLFCFKTHYVPCFKHSSLGYKNQSIHLCRAKAAVSSEIHMNNVKSLWAECRFLAVNLVAHKVTIRLQLVKQIGCSFRFNERLCSCPETGQDSGLFHS